MCSRFILVQTQQQKLQHENVQPTFVPADEQQELQVYKVRIENDGNHMMARDEIGWI